MRAAACLLALAMALGASPADAQHELRVANRADFTSMDPYAQRDSLQLDVLGNVYEPLVQRDAQFRLAPALALRWRPLSPKVWRFHLRPGVRFHDGSPFSADDVLFSFQRASAPGSAAAALVDPIARVQRIDAHTVDFHLKHPYPIFPDTLNSWYMLSQRWFASQPGQAGAALQENGTGPYRLLERRPGERSQFVRHTGYWGQIDGNVERVEFLPMPQDAARVQALLDGKVDVIDPLPLAELSRIQARPDLRVWQGPELRMMFLGMDQQRSELLYSDVKGRNPFQDARVRRAVYQAIDIKRLVQDTMQGAAIPRALLVPPQLRGYAPELDQRLPYDPEAARQLLREAGYPEGFGVKLNCPSDRYVNDAAVCHQLAQDLARVGIRLQLDIESKSAYFKKVLAGDTSFYLLGAASATGDAHNVLYPVLGSPSDEGRGELNIGRYRNPEVDRLLSLIGGETNAARRQQQMARVMALHAADVGHVPLYQQTLNWAGRKGLTLVQQPEGGMPWRYVRLPEH